jgi:hypothetical protein
MNRHERRAAASADKGFGGYRAQARRASPDISDRELGEAWMRGQAWSASGAEGMAVHERGEPSRARRDDDVLVSMSHGSGMHFKAWIAPDLLRVSVAQWGRVLDEALKPGLDRRGMSRCFILDRLVKQHYDGDTAGMMVAAIAWLIAGSPAGEIFMATDCPHTRFHYEITDIADDSGRRGQNFRLVLGHADEPLPDLVHVMPPHPSTKPLKCVRCCR